MEEKKKVDISIGGRTYPMNVDEKDILKLEKSVERVKRMMEDTENNFEVKDKVDTLSIVSIKLAGMLESKNQHIMEVEKELIGVKEMIMDIK